MERVKVTKERCKRCKYRTNVTGAGFVKTKGADSYTVVGCGYILKTGKSRAYKDGRMKPGYEHGYCDYYEPGKRVESLDSLTKNNTLKKGQKKSART